MDESRGSDPRNPANSILARRASQEDRSVEHFAAPLGPLRSGHLRFTKGAHRVVIRAELHLRDLYRASFGKRMPTVTVQRGVVTIRNTRIDRPEGVSARLCVEGGVTNLRFDDRRIGGAGGEVDLRSTDYDGATGRYDIAITGGANNVSVERRRGEERGET
jgi:hypothetical protein